MSLEKSSIFTADANAMFYCVAHEGRVAHRLANLAKIKVSSSPTLSRILYLMHPRQNSRWMTIFRLMILVSWLKVSAFTSFARQFSITNPFSIDLTDKFDFSFIFGDLNFRLDIKRLHADWLLSRKGEPPSCSH